MDGAIYANRKIYEILSFNVRRRNDEFKKNC